MKKRKKKINILPFAILLILIFSVFISLRFFGKYFKKEKEVEDNKPIEIVKEEHNFTVTLAGGVLVNSNMWTETITSDGFNFDSIFERVNDIMKKSDINFYFQQSIVGGSELGSSLYYNYNSPKEILNAMKKLDFNSASLASLHSFDKGINGITNSIKNMQENEFSYSGISDELEKTKTSIIEKNGVKIGLLSYTTKLDENLTVDYAVNIYSDELVKSDIESIKNDVDFIMVSINFNDINSTEVSEEQKRIANYLSELGVNVLIGNTSYSIQPVEKVNDMIAFYSLGNLLSGHSLIDSRISAMVDFDVKIVDKKVSISDIDVSLCYAYNVNGYKYKVIPFQEITNELVNYSEYYNKYQQLMTNDTVNINFYNIGE